MAVKLAETMARQSAVKKGILKALHSAAKSAAQKAEKKAILMAGCWVSHLAAKKDPRWVDSLVAWMERYWAAWKAAR